LTQNIRIVPRPEPGEHEIKIGVEIHRMTLQAIDALAEDASVFQRSGMLVHVVRSVEQKKLEAKKFIRPAGVPIIRPLSPPIVRERMSACATWLKYDGKNWCPTRPDKQTCDAVHARGEWGPVRNLVGVTSSPTFRADGTILQTAGYDDDTGLLYLPNCAYQPVPDAPTLDDAQSCYRDLCAATRLGDGGFPFSGEHHRAAWVCGVLTILARTAVDGPVPLFAIDANTRGAGKSLLADAAFRIALGHPAPRTTLPDEDEEMGKRITTFLLDGDAAVLIDNVKRKIEGEKIEAAISATEWKDRLLGGNTSLKARMNIVFWATGNGLEFSSDVARRAFHIRLESPLENPESRSMPDLNAWIDARRHHLVTWALTILRAWHVAGRPVTVATIGGFEAWSQMIPQAVAWASGIDPMMARATVDESVDEERMSLAAILACLEQLSATEVITVKQIITTLYGSESHDGTAAPDHHPSYQGAREAIEVVTRTKAGNTPDVSRLGKYLFKSCGRVVNGLRVVKGTVVNGRQTWRVVKVK
jgi:hypothetical protein